MSYLYSAQTKLLATYCIFCSRPLCDSESVERGIGPICAEKHNVYKNIDIPDWHMVQESSPIPFDMKDGQSVIANSLTHFVTLNYITNCPDTLKAIKTLRYLGFNNLADALTKAIISVRIEEDGDKLSLFAPYSEAFVIAIRKVNGRKWDPINKINTVPITEKVALFEVLKEVFLGRLGIGSKGIFIIV